jgi:hypothetical protein
MSSNRILYDNCNYAKTLAESTSKAEYQIFPPRNINCDVFKCDQARACSAVDRDFIGKRVNIESELRNQTRYNSRCPSRKYTPCDPDLKDIAYPDYNEGYGCQPLTYKIGYNTCMREQPTINPYTCERHVTYRTNLQMPTYRGFDRKKFDSYEYCNK